MSVVAGTPVVAAPAPKAPRSLGPVPASVLKSARSTRSTSSSGAPAVAGVPAPASVSPHKNESDESFWNFGAAQSVKPANQASSNNAFGADSVSNEFMAWCAKQLKTIGGVEDLTLVEYCATLEDPGEIREYLAAYLGSTPRVSAFATEFIQRKKSIQQTKKSPLKPSTEGVDMTGANKKGKRRTKGQKIDPSLLSYSVGSS